MAKNPWSTKVTENADPTTRYHETVDSPLSPQADLSAFLTDFVYRTQGGSVRKQHAHIHVRSILSGNSEKEEEKSMTRDE